MSLSTKQEISYILKFIPLTVIEYLLDNNNIIPPIETSYPSSTVMFADISGFTKLSAAAHEKGANGLDYFRLQTEAFLSEFVHIVDKNGGEGKRKNITRHGMIDGVLSYVLCGRCAHMLVSARIQLLQ